MLTAQNEVQRFKDINQTAEITSLGKSTIRLWEAEGRFPKSIKLSSTKRVWLESDINDWILSKIKPTTSQQVLNKD